MDGGVAVFNEPSRWSLSDLASFAAEPLRATGAIRAIAFGSYARGVADAWSDLDLVVVIETDLPKLDRSHLLGDLYDALPVSLDLLVFTPSEFEQGVRTGLDIFASLATEGTTIFPVGRDIRMRIPDRASHTWLDTARKDLDVARLAADSGFHAHACFHAHQAAEKAVKAVHYSEGARTVLGYSVRQLIERLDIASLEVLLSGARQLDLYYVPTRYPSSLDDGTPDEAFSADQSYQALDFARDIVAAAANIIAGATRDRQD